MHALQSGSPCGNVVASFVRAKCHRDHAQWPWEDRWFLTRTEPKVDDRKELVRTRIHSRRQERAPVWRATIRPHHTERWGRQHSSRAETRRAQGYRAL